MLPSLSDPSLSRCLPLVCGLPPTLPARRLASPPRQPPLGLQPMVKTQALIGGAFCHCDAAAAALGDGRCCCCCCRHGCWAPLPPGCSGDRTKPPLGCPAAVLACRCCRGKNGGGDEVAARCSRMPACIANRPFYSWSDRQNAVMPLFWTGCIPDACLTHSKSRMHRVLERARLSRHASSTP